MPAVKREGCTASPDMSTIPEQSINTPNEGSDTSHARQMQLPPAVPSFGRPYIIANQAHLDPGPYVGSSPRKYRLDVLGRRSAVEDFPTPPISCFPSRLACAMATDADNATTATTTTTTVTNGDTTTPHISNTIVPSDQQSQHEHNSPAASSDEMDDHRESADPNMYGGEVGFPPTDLREHDAGIFVSRSDLEELQYGVQLLRNEHAASEAKVQNQGVLINELITFGQTMHNMIEHLNQRIRAVEGADTTSFNQQTTFSAPAPAVQPVLRSRGDDLDRRSRSPSLEREGYRDRGKTAPKKKGRKNLAITIPEKSNVPPAPTGTLPTPLSQPLSASANIPNTPITPGRTGPPPSAKKISTCVNKRNIHNLDQMVPPPNAHIPLLPLTDVELIVYMFNSLCRPIVSLRLYARGWGPAAISDVVNTHRLVQPAYLRNTCSVKCTTAIKKGTELYGEEWSTDNRIIFQADETLDDKATDMIRLAPDEVKQGVDFEIRALCNGLKKHPDPDQGGIFTRCVQYCEETNAPYMLSNVFELASDLEAGRTPRLCRTPEPQCKMEEPSTPTHSE